MVMSPMEKSLSYFKLTLIIEKFCNLSRFATLREGYLQEFNFADRQNVFFLRELSFADQTFYKDS